MRLSRSARITTLGQLPSRCIAHHASIGEFCDRVYTDGEHFFAPGKAVFPAPILCSGWGNEDVHSSCIGYLVWLGLRFGIANRGVSQGHFDTAVRNAKPKPKPYKIADAGGM